MAHLSERGTNVIYILDKKHEDIEKAPEKEF